MSRLLAVRGAVIATATTTALLAGTAFAAAGPHISDPAGDALYAGVLNDRSADLLAVDVTLSASSLTLTDTVAAPRSTTSNLYAAEVNRAGPNNGTQLLSNVTAATATLQVSDQNGSQFVPVAGTARYDTTRGTVTATYSRAGVNAALAQLGKPALAASDQVNIAGVTRDTRTGATDSAANGDAGSGPLGG